MNKSRKDLINFSLEKYNSHKEKYPATKPIQGKTEDINVNDGNHLLHKYNNFADGLRKTTDKTISNLKTNNSATDLHNLKKNLNTKEVIKDSLINVSLSLNSPKEETDLMKNRSNANSKLNPSKLVGSQNHSNSNSNLLYFQNGSRKDYRDLSSKKSFSLLKTQSIDYSTGIEIKKICNKEILKLQKNNRNLNGIIHTTNDEEKIQMLYNKIQNNSVKNRNSPRQNNMNTSYATIDSTKSTHNNHNEDNSTKMRPNTSTTKMNSNNISNCNSKNSLYNNINPILANPPKYVNKLVMPKNSKLEADNDHHHEQSSEKLRKRIIHPMNFSPRINVEKEIKIDESLALDFKSNNLMLNNISQNLSHFDNNIKTPNVQSNKISLDKNYTIERLKNKIFKKFVNPNQTNVHNIQNIQNNISEKNKIPSHENNKGTIIKISNNINNNFHILINQPHHPGQNSNNVQKSNAALDHNISKISSHPENTITSSQGNPNTSKFSIGENLLKSNIKFKSNLSSFKELTNITQKFKNFYTGNVSFSKMTELKKPKPNNDKTEDDNNEIRLKSSCNKNESLCDKDLEEFDKILMKNELIEKDSSSKNNRESINKNTKKIKIIPNPCKISDPRQREKSSVSEEMFNLFMNKQKNNQDNNETNKNKKIILSNKDFYSSNESSANNQGSGFHKKQSDSGSLLSDESIFEISRMKKKRDKRGKYNNSSLNKISQSLKISSESNDKRSSLSKEKSTSNKDLLDVSLSYNVSDEEDLEGTGTKNSASRSKTNNQYDLDDFKKFYDDMNKKLLSYK